MTNDDKKSTWWICWLFFSPTLGLVLGKAIGLNGSSLAYTCFGAAWIGFILAFILRPKDWDNSN